jgi:hypothetical protein
MNYLSKAGDSKWFVTQCLFLRITSTQITLPITHQMATKIKPSMIDGSSRPNPRYIILVRAETPLVTGSTCDTCLSGVGMPSTGHSTPRQT